MLARGGTIIFLTALLAGCGGQGSSSSSSYSATKTSAPSASTSSTVSAGSTPATTRPGTPPASARPSGGGGLAAPARSSGGAGLNARVPASFRLSSAGSLSPRTITVPAFLAIALSVSSVDATPHRVLVRTPVAHALAVSAHGRAAIMIGGLRAGSYPVLVDGVVRGTLVIGGEPGP